MAALNIAVARPARLLPVSVLLLALAGACLVRVALAGPVGAGARGSALLFAALLLGAVLVHRPSTQLRRRAIAVGVATAGVLIAPALVHASLPTASGHAPAGSYPAWAVATAVVATAEEAFLRGVLYDAVTRIANSDLAIGVAALAFGLMHVPFYGWHALPLDIAVGVVLGVARQLSGSWTAPAIAHVGADLAGWWLL